MTSFLNSFLEVEGRWLLAGGSGRGRSLRRRGWLWEGEKGAARKVGVPFSGIFIFGTAREPVDSSEPASAPLPPSPRGRGRCRTAELGRRLRGRPDATPTSKMPPPHSCVTQSLGIQGPAQFRQALCGWGDGSRQGDRYLGLVSTCSANHCVI